jgi:arylsulfatase A-like enzyme
MKVGLDLNRPWRGRKHSVYQGGFRVPFLARWPGKVPPGSECGEMISVVDLLATVARIVDEKLPAASEGAEDSCDALPAFLGEKLEKPLRPDLIFHSADGNFAIRQGPWKWIEGKAHPDTKPGALRARAAEFKPQLYNLADDPGEKHDLIGKHPEEAKRLSDLLNRYREKGFSRP